MSWLERLLGGGAPKPAWGGWEDAYPDAREGIVRAVLEEVARQLEASDVGLVVRQEKKEGELRGRVRGFPFRLVVGFYGTVSCELRYASKLGAIDVEFDPDLEKAAGREELEPWDEDEQRAMLGPGVFLEGSGAKAELALFRALPADLQREIVSEVRRLRIRYFRSRREEHDVDFWDEPQAVADPPAWLAAGIRLAAKVAAARGARPVDAPTAKKKKKETAAGLEPGLFQGWFELDEAERADRLARGARAIAGLVRGEVSLRDDVGEVRFASEDGAALRLVLLGGIASVELHARAEGVELALELQAHPLPVEVANDDPWEAPEERFFFSRDVHAGGSRRAAREAAALAAALPEAIVRELVELAEELGEELVVSRGVLRVRVADLDDVDDEKIRGAVAVGQRLASLARALPRGDVADPDPAAIGRCEACGATYRRPKGRERGAYRGAAGCPRCGGGT